MLFDAQELNGIVSLRIRVFLPISRFGDNQSWSTLTSNNNNNNNKNSIKTAYKRIQLQVDLLLLPFFETVSTTRQEKPDILIFNPQKRKWEVDAGKMVGSFCHSKMDQTPASMLYPYQSRIRAQNEVLLIQRISSFLVLSFQSWSSSTTFTRSCRG